MRRYNRERLVSVKIRLCRLMRLKLVFLMTLLLCFTSGNSQIGTGLSSAMDSIQFYPGERGISPKRISNFQGFNLGLLKTQRVKEAMVVSNLIGYSLILNLDTFGRINSIKTKELPDGYTETYNFYYSDTTMESLVYITRFTTKDSIIYKSKIDTSKDSTLEPIVNSKYVFPTYIMYCYFNEDGLIRESITYTRRFWIFKKKPEVTRLYFYSYYP